MNEIKTNEEKGVDRLSPDEALDYVKKSMNDAINLGKGLGIGLDAASEKKVEETAHKLSQVIRDAKTLKRLNRELSSKIPQNILSRVAYKITDVVGITDADRRYERKANQYVSGLKIYVENAIEAYRMNEELVLNPILSEASATRDKLSSELIENAKRFQHLKIYEDDLKRKIEKNEEIKNKFVNEESGLNREKQTIIGTILDDNAKYRVLLTQTSTEMSDLGNRIKRKEKRIAKYSKGIQKLENYKYVVSVGLNNLIALNEVDFMDNLDKSMSEFNKFAELTLPHIDAYSMYMKERDNVRDGQLARLLENNIDSPIEKKSTLDKIVSERRRISDDEIVGIVARLV